MECMVFPLEKAQIGGITINFGMKKEDAKECIEDMKSEGTYTKESAEYEEHIANHFATIGIGVKGYY